MKQATPLSRKTPMSRGKPMARAVKPMGQAGFKRAPGDEVKPKAKVPRPKKCAHRACRAAYVPDPKQPFKTWCSDDCGAALGMARIAAQKAKAARTERAVVKAKKREQQSRKWWLATAKTALHAYIRLRDEGQCCISCDTVLVKLGRVGGDYDAGHFRSVGSAKHLEFVEDNIFGQCKYCNDHLKGNQLEYERRLRIRKGDAFVEALKADNETRKLTISDFQEIEATYKAKFKALQREKVTSEIF